MIESPDRLPEDRYLVTDLLGEGGMARVWRAWHRSRGTWCAVKVLRPQFAREASARRRFMDEARTIVKLRHRNVVEAWEVGDADPPYLVLEVADAGSLKDWSSRYGAMPPRMAVGVAIQVCKGIGAAHVAHVIHRDVNPRNVLVNRKGVCKVSDFGIARIRRDDGSEDVPDATTVHSDNAMGTLGYMAPEQRSDPRRADVRTDVYGIGATLYDLLTGQPVTNLFMAEREPEMLEGIPEVLRPILIRAVAYHPEDRYPEVAELAKALYYSRAELQEDPPGTSQLADGIPPEPLPPQGLTLPLSTGVQPMDDLEVPTTFIRKPDPSRTRTTPNSSRRTADTAGTRGGATGRSSDRRAAGSTPDPERRTSDAARAPAPVPKPAPHPPQAQAQEANASPNTHGKSRESGLSAQSWDPRAAAQRGSQQPGSRSDGSRPSRRVLQPEPSWVSGLDHELPPKRRRVWKLLAALGIASMVSALSVDVAWLQGAAARTATERNDFVKQVKSEAPVLDQLILLRQQQPAGTPIVGLGPNELNERFHLATQPAETRVQLERAHAYLDALGEAAAPFVDTQGRREEAVLKAGIQGMSDGLAEWESAWESWRWRATTPWGRIPIGLRLATDPELQ